MDEAVREMVTELTEKTKVATTVSLRRQAADRHEIMTM